MHIKSLIFYKIKIIPFIYYSLVYMHIVNFVYLFILELILETKQKVFWIKTKIKNQVSIWSNEYTVQTQIYSQQTACNMR